MKIKNKIFFWLIVSFAILNIADGLTALKILAGEANPLFLLTGSIWIVYLLKILFVGSIIYIYRKNMYPSHFMYFFFIMILLYGNILLMVGVSANMIAAATPDYEELVSDVTPEQKVQEYSFIIMLIYIIPMSICLLGFKFYEWSVGSTNLIKPKKKIKEVQW